VSLVVSIIVIQMDKFILEHANAIFVRESLAAQSRTAKERRIIFAEMTRRGLAPYDGMAVARLVESKATFIGELMRARLNSFERAFEDAKHNPTLEEFQEIWRAVEEEYSRCLKAETARAARRAASEQRPFDASQQPESAPAMRVHDEVLAEFNVWRSRVGLIKVPKIAPQTISPLKDFTNRVTMPEENVTPSSFLKSAIKAVPAVKYAVGIGGIVAVIAIVKTFSVSSRDAILGTVVMVVLMVALVIVAKFAAQTTSALRPLIFVLAWFCLVLFMATAICLFSSSFFGRPLDLRGAIQGPHSGTQEQQSAKTGSSTNPQAPALSKQARTSQLRSLLLVNCQPIGTQDSISVNSALKKGPTFTSFYTEGKEQTVPFLRRPERLYVEPPGKTVAMSDLPAQITLGKCGDKDCKITVKEFTDKGVVVDTGAAIVLTEKRETCGVQVKMTMLEAAVKPIASAKPLPATAESQKPESQESKVPVVSAPNGIAIGGGNVINPTVNNFGPPPPNVAWEYLNDHPMRGPMGPLPESPHPRRWIKISIDGTFLDAKFAVFCDRPCKAVTAEVDVGNAGGFSTVRYGPSKEQPSIVGVVVDQPNPLPEVDPVNVCMESTDDRPVTVVKVTRLTITP
jgi:hypothetical protein